MLTSVEHLRWEKFAMIILDWKLWMKEEQYVENKSCLTDFHIFDKIFFFSKDCVYLFFYPAILRALQQKESFRLTLVWRFRSLQRQLMGIVPIKQLGHIVTFLTRTISASSAGTTLSALTKVKKHSNKKNQTAFMVECYMTTETKKINLFSLK